MNAPLDQVQVGIQSQEHNRALPVCIFANETSTTPGREMRISWDGILALHQKHKVRTQKSGLMLGGYAINGIRCDVNVPYRSIIQLDIDTKGTKDKVTGRMLEVKKVARAIDEIRLGIDQYEWCAASSHWHEPDRGVIRYRVVMLPDRDILPDEHEAILEAIDELLGGDVLDRDAWQWSQAFFLPSCPQESEAGAFFIHNTGIPLPVDQFVARGHAILQARAGANQGGQRQHLTAGAKSRSPETPESIARMKSALNTIDPDMDRKPWRDVCWSVAAHGWQCGYELAADWSQRGQKWDDAEFDKVWNSFDPEREGGIRAGTLYHYAREAGWVDAIQSAEESVGDIANARRLAAIANGKMLFVFPAAKWLRWDASRWVWCEAGEDMRMAKHVADRQLDDAANAFKASPNDPNTKKQMIHATKTCDERRLVSMVNLAKSEPSMGVGSMEKLDADPWVLNVQNGVVSLHDGTVLDHDPKMLLTRKCTAMYLRDEPCPRWLQFLDEIFQGDQDLVAYIQRALGYSLTGLVTEEVLFFMFGYGANGKSVFINVVCSILNDYAVTAPATMLAMSKQDNKGRATPEMARLAGARYAFANETQSGDRLDEQLVKVLVSRERIAARNLFAGYFEFVPSHALWVRGNHKPIIAGDDHGIWRRIHLIPFLRTFSAAQQDPFLEQKLLDERDGILTWMIEGCLEWQRVGLAPPAAVTKASAEYRQESDVLGAWLTECCDIGPTLKDAQKVVFADYVEWCKQNGYRSMSKAQFTRKLAERGFVQGWIGSKKRAYLGLCLKRTRELAIEVAQNPGRYGHLDPVDVSHLTGLVP
jgi:putative DNA primase/helicase